MRCGRFCVNDMTWFGENLVSKERIFNRCVG
jgi:hypothetical protein